MGVSLTIEQINAKKPARSRLSAVSFSNRKHPKHRIRYVNALCECGNTKEVALSELTLGGTISCGCLKTKATIDRNTKYIGNVKGINHVYLDMIYRCYDPKCPNYKWYGAKGVKVCDEWRNNYQAFLDWAKANGWEKGLQLDKDIKGDGTIYSPETCCFVTARENLAAVNIQRNTNGTFKKAS